MIILLPFDLLNSFLPHQHNLIIHLMFDLIYPAVINKDHRYHSHLSFNCLADSYLNSSNQLFSFIHLNHHSILRLKVEITLFPWIHHTLCFLPWYRDYRDITMQFFYLPRVLHTFLIFWKENISLIFNNQFSRFFCLNQYCLTNIFFKILHQQHL